MFIIFGEKGWNSRQSLNQLINLIGDGHTPKKVIFFDGLNDAILQCRSDVKKLPTHPFEKNKKKAFF